MAFPDDPIPLRDLMRQLFGAHAEVRSSQVCQQRNEYVVLHLGLDKPRLDVIVKLAGAGAPYPCPFERTAALTRRVEVEMGLHMPATYAADETCAVWPWRFLVKEYLPGIVWAAARNKMSTAERTEAQSALGCAIARLHTLRFSSFGELEPDATHVVEGLPLLAALRQRAGRYLRPEVPRAFYFDLLERSADLFAGVADARLCHEDLHGYNILFERQGGVWKLQTLLDFDKAWAGHTEIDLARMAFWRGMTSPTFWEAYTAVWPLSPGFEKRRLIYQLQWCLEYPALDARHRADTARACRALGLTAPDF